MSQNSKEQAQAQLSSIIAMTKALNVDYERLEELRGQINDEDSFIDDGSTMDEAREELAQLEADANGNENEEQAREAIQNDALDVSFRSGWSSSPHSMSAEEFRILLCTGGPAVQIVGELNDNKEPCNVKIEHQDWYEQWESLEMSEEETNAVLQYCQVFYFGE